MRRILLALLAIASGVACGNSDVNDVIECGPNGSCPSGYTCDTKDNRCIKNGTTPDARSVDAKPVDAAPVSDAKPDAATPDAPPPPIDAPPPPIDARPIDAPPPIDAPTGGPDAPGPVVPTAVITSGAEGMLCQGHETFTYLASNDPNATFQCTVDGNFMACDAAGTAFNFPDGTTQTFQVRAVNAAGTGPTTSRMCLVDAVAPIVDITKPASGTTVSSPTEVTFTVSEPATLVCQLGTVTLDKCESGMKLPLENGMYTLIITATDAAGNVGVDMTVFTVNITGPLTTISFPTAAQVTGGNVDFQFSVAAGTARTDCTIDGDPVACAAPGFSQAFDVSGTHVFTAQSFDGANHAGNLAAVTWEVDASPPIIDPVTVTDTGGGSVRVDFTVTDRSVIKDIQCSLDGANFTSCGQLSVNNVVITFVNFTELTPGVHNIEIYAVDIWNNSGQTDAGTDAPASNVIVSFTTGGAPGHLSVIGYDYFVNIITKLPGTPNFSDEDRLLRNAVLQSPAPNFSRGANVLLLDANSQAGELDGIDFALQGLNLNFTSITVDDLPTMLAGADILLIADQNGDFNIKASQQLAQSLAGPFLSFLNAGGDIVVLDGTAVINDRTQASQTVGILAPSVLDIQFEDRVFESCFTVPCNDEDPLLEGINPSGEICHGSHAVMFGSIEPWVVYSSSEEGGDEFLVMHKWFGKATATGGPIAWSSNDGTLNRDRSGFPVWYQDDEGVEIRQCQTLSNGTAVHHMLSGGYLSAGQGQENFSFLFTGIGLEPLDLVNIPSSSPQETFSVNFTVDLDSAVNNAFTYRVAFGCSETTGGATTGIQVSTSGVCANADGTFNLTAEALDESGNLVAYAILVGVASDAAQPVQMPPWKTPNLHSSFNLGSLTDVDFLDLRISELSDEIEYFQNQLEPSTGGTFNFFSDAGTGTDKFDFLTRYEGVVFNPIGEFVSRTERTLRGGFVTTTSTNLGNVMMPKLTNPMMSFDINGFMNISWSAAGSLAGADGTLFAGIWSTDGATHVWFIEAPPGLSFHAPPVPGRTAAFFWPDPETGLQLGFLQVNDVSYLPTYQAFRQFPTATAPGTFRPAANFTIRQTEIFPVQNNNTKLPGSSNPYLRDFAFGRLGK